MMRKLRKLRTLIKDADESDESDARNLGLQINKFVIEKNMSY